MADTGAGGVASGGSTGNAGTSPSNSSDNSNNSSSGTSSQTSTEGIADSTTTAESLAEDTKTESKTTAESLAAQPTTAEALSGIGSLDNATNHASSTDSSVAEGLVSANTENNTVDTKGLASSLNEAAKASPNTYEGIRAEVDKALPDEATKAALSAALNQYPAARDVPPGVAYSREEIARLEKGLSIPGIATNPNAHNYSDISRVANRTDYAARRATVDGLLRDPAPPSMQSSFNPFEDRDLNKRAPVRDGQFTDIANVGRVYHYVDEKSGSVVNITAEGHSLHPGYVNRGVYQGTDGTYVVSNGSGTGSMKDLNNIVGPVVWSESADEIQQHLNEQGIQ